MTWFPSRHPDLDRDFYERKRPWPHGDRLFVKRFGEGRSEMGYIQLAGEDAEPAYDLYVGGALVRQGVSAADLLQDRWEVD